MSEPMSRAGRSAQARADALRKRRREKLRRYWPVVLIAIGLAFVFGYLLPRIIHGAVSTSLNSLVPGSGGIAEWPFMTEMSLGIGIAMAVAAAIGLLRPSRSEVAWGKGASGERRVGRAVDALNTRGVSTLHDRLIPGSRANIDHIALTSAGVFTVDAKRYAGRLQIRSRGSQLWINGRNRSKLLAQAHLQARAVESVLAQAGLLTINVTPVLCFVGTEVPLLSPRRINGVIICTPGSLRRHINPRKATTLDPDQIANIAGLLGARLHPADPATQTGPSHLDAVVENGGTLPRQASLWHEDQDTTGISSIRGKGAPTANRRRSHVSKTRASAWSWVRIANFRARSRRSEFWAAMAVGLVVTATVSYVDNVRWIDTGYLALLSLAVLVWPFWGALVNRLHDIGRTGWMSLLLWVPLVNLVFFIWLGTKPGQQGPNRWGPPVTRD